MSSGRTDDRRVFDCCSEDRVTEDIFHRYEPMVEIQLPLGCRRSILVDRNWRGCGGLVVLQEPEIQARIFRMAVFCS
jgi:hypothetical protein